MAVAMGPPIPGGCSDLCSDGDGDGLGSCEDNCPDEFNPSQTDGDGDGLGDACDPCLQDAGNDADRDGECDSEGDCDDLDADVYSGAPQLCGDSKNNDCDHPSWPLLTGTNEFDDDGDGTSECAGDCDDTRPLCKFDCTDPDGDDACGTFDCAPDDSSIFPGNVETCDGIDSNCSDDVDDDVCVVGDRAWEDQDGDGIQDAGEPGIPGVLTMLFDGGASWLGTTVTDASGSYAFDDLDFGQSYFVKFFVPSSSFFFTAPDQGGDDLLDSDADPFTGQTPVFPLLGPIDAERWDAGMRSDSGCTPPDEPVYVFVITLDANNFPVLHFMDPNQPEAVTGYQIYRSSDPALPPGTWPLLASDVIDMDEATPNKQWVDTTGDVSPSGMWFYQVTAFNHHCPAEGPF